jgi:hypothetical protein
MEFKTLDLFILNCFNYLFLYISVIRNMQCFGKTSAGYLSKLFLPMQT